jgi:hypothetical protein
MGKTMTVDLYKRFYSIFEECLSNKDKHCIFLRTGGGKTYNSISVLNSFVKEKKIKRAVFIVPFVSLKKDIETSYEGLTTDKSLWSTGILLICPESFTEDVYKKADIIVVDEIHMIPSSKTYRSAYNRIHSLFSKRRKKPIVALTGTPISGLFKDNVIEHDLDIQLPYNINVHYVYSNEPVVAMFRKYEEMDNSNGIQIIYWNSKAFLNYFKENVDMVVVSEAVSNENIDVELNGQPMIRNVLNTGDITGIESIYCTSCFTTGISIKTPVKEVNALIYYDETVTILDIIQLINRFRNIESGHINVTLIVDSKERIKESATHDVQTYKRVKKDIDANAFAIWSKYFKDASITGEYLEYSAKDRKCIFTKCSGKKKSAFDKYKLIKSFIAQLQKYLGELSTNELYDKRVIKQMREYVLAYAGMLLERSVKKKKTITSFELFTASILLYLHRHLEYKYKHDACKLLYTYLVNRAKHYNKHFKFIKCSNSCLVVKFNDICKFNIKPENVKKFFIINHRNVDIIVERFLLTYMPEIFDQLFTKEHKNAVLEAVKYLQSECYRPYEYQWPSGLPGDSQVIFNENGLVIKIK